MNNSYEQYADQLLDKVFQNARRNHPYPIDIQIDWDTKSNPSLLHQPIESSPALPEPVFEPIHEPVHEPIHEPTKNHRDLPEPIQLPHKSFLKDTLSRKMRRKKQFRSAPRKKLDSPKEPTPRKPAGLIPEESISKGPMPHIQRQPSFWKPREERPKGWWKGGQGSVKPKVASVKRPKRPMAFKVPKSKAVAMKPKETTALESKPDETIAFSPYIPPFMMVQPANNAGCYFIPSHPSMMIPQQQPQQKTTVEKPVVRKKKVTMQNPREAANDRCTLM